MPRSITPVSVRITNGTSAPSTFVVATSLGSCSGSGSGFTVPSLALYDHEVLAGASQFGGDDAARPAATVVHTHGSRWGPEKIGPLFGWLATVSVTRDAPVPAAIVLSPS